MIVVTGLAVLVPRGLVREWENGGYEQRVAAVYNMMVPFRLLCLTIPMQAQILMLIAGIHYFQMGEHPHDTEQRV